MSRPFLTAAWRKLVLANYAVEPALLAPFVPAGTQLDLWKGACYVSLVGFLFENTRLRGLPIPFHRTFEEVNLRFYVKREEAGETRRGVVFVQEIVPKPALTWVARTIYGEPYRTLPMRHVHDARPDAGELLVRYEWQCAGRWQSLEARGRLQPDEMPPGSEAEFITEHYWGYTRRAADRTDAYAVTHPRWRVHELIEHRVAVDFGAVYGERFAFLNDATPRSVMLAEGSEIAVMEGERVKG